MSEIQSGNDHRPVFVVSVRGRRIAVEETAPLSVVLLALLALEDPRVDGVLAACGVRVQDTEGNPVFPEEGPLMAVKE